MRAILAADPTITLSVVLGRNVRSLYTRAKSIKDDFPDRVKLIGWTKRVPELLTSHHLAIGKAGGATVHEAIGARCPMLIHHLVPGQEEGNLQLLEAIGAGHLAETEEAITAAIRQFLANEGAAWRQAKRQLTAHAKPNAATTAGDYILSHLTP